MVIDALMMKLKEFDFEEKLVIMDIGSKWDKTTHLLKQLGYKNVHLIAVRPTM
jgi:hypothetical protein